MLDRRITEYVESNGLRSIYQGGFRPQRGTAEQTFILNHLIEAARGQGQRLYCAFVDFRKAYDSVRHPHLWDRLEAYGISGNVLQCIRSLYAQSRVSVNVNGQFTDFIKVLVGVRQGDPLSPTLFGLFVEVLEQYIRQSIGSDWRGKVPELLGVAVFMLLYADDVVLIANDPDTLQAQLQALEQYCHDWDMDVNLSKTKVVVFRRPGQARLARTWQFAGRAVEVADSYKYLGTIFHETKLLKQASQQLAAAGQRALYAVKSMCYQQDITDPSLRLHFWQQLVLPVVSFGSEIWAGLYPFFDDASYMTNTPAEQVHMHFTRWYLGARGSTHKRILLHAAHRLPLMQHWLQRTIQLWNKLAKVDPDTWLAHRAFVANVRLWQSGDNDCWAARTIGHLSHLGMIDTNIPELWSVQLQPVQVEISMDAMETANWESYMQPFYRHLPNIRGIGRTLYYYAQHFSCMHTGAKRQVYHNIPQWQWRPIMQLATGQTKLRCITSRWQGYHDTAADCPCCPGHLEDPVHYVLQCPGLADIRHQFGAVDDAANNLEYGVAPHTAMKLLFRRENFADLAGYLSKVYRRRFSAINGVEAMKAVAAGRDPVDDVAALSQESDAEEDG